MQRSSLAFLLVIVVLSGLLVRSVAFRSSSSVVPPADLAAIETVEGFYDALNGALSGAPVDPVAALLSPIFVDHVSDTGALRSADAFLDQVRAIGASPQRLRLEVMAVEASGNTVVVGIRPVRNGATEVAGVTVEQAMPGPYYEVIRVQRGKIVDRWAPGFRWLDAAESSEAPAAIASFSGINVGLMRVMLTDSEEHAWKAQGIGLIVVESGSALLHVTDDNVVSAPVVLAKGAFTSMLHGARGRLRSADGKPVSVVIYIATKIGPSSASLPVGDLNNEVPAASMVVLWSATHYWTHSATVHRPARIVLPVGEAIELTRSVDTDLLLAGDTGIIEVGNAGGSVAVLGEDRWPVTSEGVVQLDANHAASITGGGTVFVQNMSDAPVTLVLVSIERAPNAASPAAAE